MVQRVDCYTFRSLSKTQAVPAMHRVRVEYGGIWWNMVEYGGIEKLLLHSCCSTSCIFSVLLNFARCQSRHGCCVFVSLCGCAWATRSCPEGSPGANRKSRSIELQRDRQVRDLKQQFKERQDVASQSSAPIPPTVCHSRSAPIDLHPAFQLHKGHKTGKASDLGSQISM